MKKILPFSDKPFLNSYSFLSYFLGIFEGKGYNVRPFCYNNFISLIYARTFNERFIMFIKAFPEGGKLRKLFDLQPLKREQMTIDNLCQFISEDKYVIVTLNFRAIIKEEGCWYHDWLVYGFDDEQKLFKIIGFAPNEKNGVLKYEKHELPFEQFIKALPSTKVKTKAKYLKNCTISIKNDYEIENVNFKIIKRKLRMYLRTFSPFFLNIKIYEHYSKVLLRIKNKADYIDLRPLAVMRDHKYILLRLIQEEGAKKKNFLLDYDFLKCKKVEIAKVDFKDINRLRDFINDGFEFKDKVSINVRDNKIVYEVFGKETYIEIIKSTPKVVPADITLKTKSEIMFIPTKQIDLRDYIVKATDSNGNNIREKVKICVDGVEKYIIDSQEEEKIIIVEYSYNDLYTKLIKQNLQLIFKAQHIALTGTFNDENKLLYVRTAKNYSICFDNTISSLINQINKLTLAENREVISCCIRVLFELSVKCLIHSSKNITIKSSLRNGKIHDQIETIISFCQQQTIKEKIAKRTEFEFHTLDNTLFKEDFINAYKKSNLGPHSATSYLTDNDIIDISKKAAFFLLLINEIITNPNIM